MASEMTEHEVCELFGSKWSILCRMEGNRKPWNIVEWRAMLWNGVESAVMEHNKGLQHGWKRIVPPLPEYNANECEGILENGIECCGMQWKGV